MGVTGVTAAAGVTRAGELAADRRGTLSGADGVPIFEGMAERLAQRALRAHHTPWWLVCACASLTLLVVAGLAAATGLFE